jgi:hypothetical protein
MFDHRVTEGQANASRPDDFLTMDRLWLADFSPETHPALHAFFQVDKALFLLAVLFILNVGNSAYRAIVGALLTSDAFLQVNLHLALLVSFSS